MKINIGNYRLYSSEELRSYAEKGLLTFEGADDSLISEAILYMLEGMYTEGELQSARDEGFKEGQEEGLSDHDSYEIRRAISILEDLV